MEIKDPFSIINSFSSKHILVIGDLILDIYLKGVSTRLSPEAPVPVVDVVDKISILGGAANVVCNLASLGARVTFASIIGNDSDGDLALNLLHAHKNVNIGFVIQHDERQTITKTRVVAGSHFITRFDYGSSTPVDKPASDRLIENIRSCYVDFDAVIISDYDKGVITDNVIDALQELQQQHRKIVGVDSKRLGIFKRTEPTLVKPNYEEAIRLANIPFQPINRAAQIEHAHSRLMDETHAKLIIVTMDAEGSLIMEEEGKKFHVEAPNVSSPHVAGAGDTYMGAFMLSYLSGASSQESGVIATAAATLAIRKEWTTACTVKELLAYFNSKAKYIVSLDELKMISDAYHEAGKKIVFTNGCFDILHSGHVAYLHCAKELGDVLIVGVNNDASIRRLKGESRPINPLTDRLQVLAGLHAIDHIIPFGGEDDDTPVPLIKAVRPHVFAKGGDYTKEKLPEAETVESVGGEIVFLPHVPDHSTTEIINRINKTIAAEKEQFQMEASDEFME